MAGCLEATGGAETVVPASGATVTGGRLRALGGAELAAGALGFLGLTAGVFWYQLSRVSPGDATPTWGDLRWGYLGLILLLLPVETLASASRIWLLARVLQPGVTFRTSLQAEWANVAISLLTPSQSGGGPGQVYMLSRGGASVGTALTIALISFLGTMVGLLGMGLYSLLVSGVGATGPLFAGAVWVLTAVAGLMTLGAAWPGLFGLALAPLSRVPRLVPLTTRLTGLVYAYRDDVRRFLRHGKRAFVLVCLLSVTFLLARALMPLLCARFLGLAGGSPRAVLEAQIALVFLVFFAPTPGGAGIAEGTSLSVMAEVVPPGFAPLYHLIWRFATVYLAALAGLLCLGHALAEDARRALGGRRGP